MALLIIIEVILSVAFAFAMLIYMGVHFSQAPLKETGGDAVSIGESDGNDSADILKEALPAKKAKDYLSRESINSAFKFIKSKKLIWLFVAMLAFSVATWFYDMYYLELAMLKSYMNSLVFSLIITVGYIDYKEHIIPNPLILTGMGIWVIGYLLEVFVGGTAWKEALLFSLLGFAVCGGLLLILAVILHSGIGMGDVKIFAMLGLLYGLENTYSLLICTVIPMAIIAIILLAKKRVSKKSTLPMAPFIVLAFLIGILGGI